MLRLIRIALVCAGAKMTTNDAEGYLESRRFVSVKEAARYLGVSYHFLWRRMGTEDGPPSQRVGYCWKIPKDEFIEWAKQPVIR
jgi:excisionase family DNA binding protein